MPNQFEALEAKHNEEQRALDAKYSEEKNALSTKYTEKSVALAKKILKKNRLGINISAPHRGFTDTIQFRVTNDIENPESIRDLHRAILTLLKQHLHSNGDDFFHSNTMGIQVKTSNDGIELLQSHFREGAKESEAEFKNLCALITKETLAQKPTRTR